MKSGASGTTGSSMPLKRTWTAPAFTPGAIEHVLQAHAGPARVSHRAMRPLRARDARLEIAARIARALIDRNKLHLRQRKEIVERQRQVLIDMAVHRQPEGSDIDLGRNDRPVPAHEKPVVRREDRSIEHFERRFKQRRSRALQDERPLLGKGCGHQPLVRPARQRKLDDRVGQRRRRGQRQESLPRRFRETAAGEESERGRNTFSVTMAASPAEFGLLSEDPSNRN